MLKTFPPFLRAVTLLTLMIVCSYVVIAYYNRLNTDLVSFYQHPSVTDTAGQPKRVFRAGDPAVVVYSVERSSNRCFGDYIQLLDGPVTVQFGHARSQVITTTMVHRQLKYLYHLPDDLPAGDYKWTQLVYPTCSGEEVPPHQVDIGNITIR